MPVVCCDFSHVAHCAAIDRMFAGTAVFRVSALFSAVAAAPVRPRVSRPQAGAAAAALNASVAQSTAVPANEQATAAAWQTWLAGQHLTGNGAIPDYPNPEQMNRYTWYQAHGWKVPYPGDSKIYLPSQVPGAYIPSAETS